MGLLGCGPGRGRGRRSGLSPARLSCPHATVARAGRAGGAGEQCPRSLCALSLGARCRRSRAKTRVRPCGWRAAETGPGLSPTPACPLTVEHEGTLSFNCHCRRTWRKSCTRNFRLPSPFYNLLLDVKPPYVKPACRPRQTRSRASSECPQPQSLPRFEGRSHRLQGDGWAQAHLCFLTPVVSPGEDGGPSGTSFLAGCSAATSRRWRGGRARVCEACGRVAGK